MGTGEEDIILVNHVIIKAIVTSRLAARCQVLTNQVSTKNQNHILVHMLIVVAIIPPSEVIRHGSPTSTRHVADLDIVVKEVPVHRSALPSASFDYRALQNFSNTLQPCSSEQSFH